MTPKIPFTNPEHQLAAFNCPHCGAYANMLWFKPTDKTLRSVPQGNMKDTEAAKCTACLNFSHWVNNIMVYPIFETQVDDPNDDLPEKVKVDYTEAASIVASSPRGAAALLRLAIQKLCDELVSESGDLSFKIGKLVETGLNKKIQQALDIVRVVGNNAVHPGQIDLNDKPEVAKQLFLLVNMIAQQMITEPAEVDAMFESLPEAAKESVKNRDKK
jgi:hypothetical protein